MKEGFGWSKYRQLTKEWKKYGLVLLGIERLQVSGFLASKIFCKI